MKLFIAKMDTSRYSFEGFGTTPEEAEAALRSGWSVHCKQTPYCDPSLIDEDGIWWVQEYAAGYGYRDGQPMTNQPGKNKSK